MQRELVRRAQAGDHDAFAVIVRGALARLTASARFILRDADRAEDAVQDALIEAWRDIGDLREADRLDAWLHRLLVRACYRSARRTRRREITEITLLPVHDRSVPDGLGLLSERDQIASAFLRLTQDQRTVLTLVYFADLSMADAAEVLGIPLGTTKSRLHNALKALRAAIAADERTPALKDGQLA